MGVRNAGARLGAPIRITHLITGLQIGGAEKMLAKLVVNMDRTRFSNRVISMTPVGPVGQELERAGIPIVSLGMQRGIADPVSLMRLIALLRRDPPTILQTWLYHADLMGLVAGRWASVPHILWNIRCSDLNRGNYRWFSRHLPELLGRLSRMPDGVVVNSVAGQRIHQQYGYQPRGWSVIPNGFDMDRFAPQPGAREALRCELGLSDDTLLIGLPARLDPMKDHMAFLAAAMEMVPLRPDVRFVLIGRGLSPDNAGIVGRIAAAGLADNISLMGERQDMARIMAGLDVVTLTSAFGEGFPTVLGEAMACGVPCVTTSVGDAAAIVGDTGIVVPPRDPSALAVAWRTMMAMGTDARAALGATARRRIQENYSLPIAIQRYEALYGELATLRAAA